MTNLFDKLKAPFPREKISWRVGSTNAKKNGGTATKGIALAYIDARDVMERLDSVVGPENWQCMHPHANGKTSCRLGIKIDGEWVWKENGAGDSDTEAEKGAFSDSFKRAAVLWGIGRYLYNVPNVWVPLNEYRQIVDSASTERQLSNALSVAEGHKSEEAPDDPVQPANPTGLSEMQMKGILDKIKEAKTPKELQAAKDNATHFRIDMTKDQRETVRKTISDLATMASDAVESRSEDFNA